MSRLRTPEVFAIPYLHGSVFLPAVTKLGQGNVFTGVCDSVNRGGLPQCMLGYHHHPPPRTRPPRADPPWSRAPGADPLEQTPLLDQTPPRSRPPGPDPPWTRPPPGSRLRDTINERPVRILLECILVT